jgi:hypothetical protein
MKAITVEYRKVYCFAEGDGESGSVRFMLNNVSCSDAYLCLPLHTYVFQEAFLAQTGKRQEGLAKACFELNQCCRVGALYNTLTLYIYPYGTTVCKLLLLLYYYYYYSRDV